MIRNLGQVAAIYIGSSAPRNTNLIWLDNTVVPFVFRAYDGSAWSEIATHKWVRAYVDGWLVTLPPRQLADDGDYMLINSNNVNYKITVKDFVKSAVGNPLDFKGVIRVSADFPNPSTLEAGDMYVIITSPVGGTVTDPYSGKTFEDSEKIVWDEVTRSWESLGKINITVNLTTSYSETEVTIHSSAGKETTIQGATDQLAGVMLPGQYSWLQALSNGSIVPGDPSPLTPLTPAHKHNYNDIINRLVSQQGTGESTIDPMSQKATTDALNLKFDKASVLQVSGAATDKVMSQKAVTDALKTLSDDFNNKLTNYLPLAGGTMKGNIRFPIGNGIACNDVAGTAAYVVLRTWNANNSTRMYVGTVNFPTYISSTASDLIHDRNGSSYLLWDAYNLPTPASTTDLANYLPLIGGTLTGQLTIKQEANIKLRLQSTDADNHCIIQAINSQASQLGVFGYAGDKWVIGHNGTYYEIWDKYNLTNPVTYTTDTYNYATLRNKDGQYFTYIKAGTNGLLPHSKATLVSGGSGSLGTSDQSFNAAYINNLHTNKITFGVTGPYITGSTSATQFLDANGDVQKVATGGLYVGPSYASDALSLVPANGIYSSGVIKGAAGFSSNFRQANLNLASTAAYSLYISSFIEGSTSAPGADPISGRIVNDGVLLTYFWGGDFAFQLAGDIDGSGIAYRSYAPSTGVSSLGWRFLADTSWVVSKINSSTSNYLPLTGGTLSGNLVIAAATSNPLRLNNTTSTGNECFVQVQLEGTNKAAIGFMSGYGSYIHNYEYSKYLFVKSDGAYFGTMSSNTKLALITDIPTVSGYLPLSGGTMTGALTMNNRRERVVVDVVAGRGNNWNEGAGALSVQVPSDNGQTPLLVARRSGAAIDTTTAAERLLSMELLNTGNTFRITLSNTSTFQLDLSTAKGFLFGKTIATTDQIPSIPSISITTSGSGSVVTGISASGHTLTVTKGSASMSVSWNDITGKPSSFTPSAHTHNYLTVLDNRDVTMLPNNIGGSGRFQTFFNMTGMPDSQWWSGIWVNGWANTYASWQLAGPSLYGTPPANGLYFRSGVNTTWNSWKRVAFADEIPTRTSDLTNNSGFLTSSSLSGYATQSWANGRFASLSLYNTTGSYTTIRTRGNEFCLGNTIATSASNEVIVNYRIPSGCTYAPSTWVWRAGSSTSYANGYWGSLYMNGDLVATQTWVNNKGYLTSHQTIYNLTFQAGTFSAKTFDPNGAAATVNIPTNTSHLTNDSGFITSSALNGYATQAWVNSQNFVKSTSTKKVTDIQPVDALPATQASGVLYLVFG